MFESLLFKYTDRSKHILGLQPRDVAAMLVVYKMKIISKNVHENRVYFPEEIIFLFLATNMAGMKSLANQQLKLGFTPLQYDLLASKMSKQSLLLARL